MLSPTERAAKRQLSTSLKRTGAEYFDYYLLHALMKKNYQKYEDYHIWDFVKEKKAKGLIKHFAMVAEEGGLPVILYNVPSRTGVTIEPATYEALAEHPGIVAIKEASGAMAKTVDTMSRVAGKLTLYSGNDEEVVPLMSIGAQGVISVLSNLLPAKTNEMCTRFLNGDVKGAAAMQLHYRPLIDALFCEVNPIPVKAAMAAMGFCEDYLRMPLTSMEPEHKANLLALMRKEGLNV